MPRRREVFRVGLLLTGAALTGCDGKLAGLSDAELQDRSYACSATAGRSAGFAISCSNYRRECARRRDQGHFVC